MIRAASPPSKCFSGRSPRIFGGNLRATATGTVISFCKEITVKHPMIPFTTDIPLAPVERLASLIAAARADIAAADAEAAQAEADMAAIEPHPHAHGYTAGGDCRYAGLRAEQHLPLAALLAQPWRTALGALEDTQRQHGLDYLLKAVPLVLDETGSEFADDGATALSNLGLGATARHEHKPFLAIGMLWHAFGFHCRDRHAWIGLFAYDGQASNIVAATPDIADTTTLGEALAATVKARAALLAPLGKRELHARAARRDAERQASWSAVPESYREHGAWRERAPTKRQRHLMQRIEAARGLPMIEIGRRGATADRITAAGGNPRFDLSRGEKA